MYRLGISILSLKNNLNKKLCLEGGGSVVMVYICKGFIWGHTTIGNTTWSTLFVVDRPLTGLPLNDTMSFRYHGLIVVLSARAVSRYLT